MSILEDSDVFHRMKMEETKQHIARLFLERCKTKLIRGFGSDSLIDFLDVLRLVAKVEADRRAGNDLLSMIRGHEAVLCKELRLLSNALKVVTSLTLVQECEITSLLQVQAETIAEHLLGINPASEVWKLTLMN